MHLFFHHCTPIPTHMHLLFHHCTTNSTHAFPPSYFIISTTYSPTCTLIIQHMHSHTNNLALFPSLFHPHALSIITTTFTLKQSPTYSPIPPIKTHAFIHKKHISFSYTRHHKHIQSFPFAANPLPFLHNLFSASFHSIHSPIRRNHSTLAAPPSFTTHLEHHTEGNS